MLVFSEAVPKKILDLMNVENITRENVASHLQVEFLSLSLTVHFIMLFTMVYHCTKLLLLLSQISERGFFLIYDNTALKYS
jgi:hypothetical protein